LENQLGLAIERLGPLQDTSIELGGLTVLIGPPASGKTYTLNAIFDILKNTDLELLGACIFRKAFWGDNGIIFQELYKNKILNPIFDFELRDNKLVATNFKLCIDPSAAARIVEKCLRNVIIPAESKYYTYMVEGGRKEKISILKNLLEAVNYMLVEAGFEKHPERGYCYSVDKPLAMDPVFEVESEEAGFKFYFKDRSLENDMFKGLIRLLVLNRMLQESEELRRTLQAVSNNIKAMFESEELKRYRPVYAWMGRGLITHYLTSPNENFRSIMRGLGLFGLGMTYALPAYSYVKAVVEGLDLYDSPEAPPETGLLYEIVRPIVKHSIVKNETGLYIVVGEGRVLPFRLAHGSAFSAVGLLLASLPLVREGGGFLLVDEVEHLLHPSGQALMPLFLLALAGLGIRVVAATHSTAVASVAAKIASVGTTGREGRRLVEGLYEVLGFDPPSGEAIDLILRGARRGVLIYNVEHGKVRRVENPMEWLGHLSEAWYELAGWVSSDVDNSYGEPVVRESTV